jgi:hypothetical protein
MGTSICGERVKGPFAPAVEKPTTSLGNWCATAVFWRPPVAGFLNERTLLPLLLPLAPATTLVKRFPDSFRVILESLGVNPHSSPQNDGHERWL